ncbi:hypothetical protein F5Y09DRAFT_357671 [Xylaria sp. FL1042]|nr:hypothetical protein F5Y09DRAFT_357671 [Xylaria sp. FL1042]
MANKAPDPVSDPKPKWTSFNSLEEGPYEFSLLFLYLYQGVQFNVLASCVADQLPKGYDLELSIERRLIEKFENLTLGTASEVDDDKINELLENIADLASAACLPLMREKAPHNPL